ncbi:MAG: molecular chaperone DnaJ [Nocardioidaceae bacterium]|jgi:molecular chaperone DnaJ|nr:molecular chaperone DnaJ [Nocardioidaceae bacterium]
MSPSDWVEKDFYQVLGVSKDASADEIKKAYRKLARANHPDSNPGDAAAEERFKSISEAYSVLSDPQHRKEYDEQRTLFGGGGFRTPRAGGRGYDYSDIFTGSRSGGSGGLNDLFGGIFGGGRGRSAPRRGQDVETEASLTFDQAIEGLTVSLRLSSDEACPACAGTGARAGTVPRVCPNCEGSGMQTSSDGGVFSMTEPCRECLGRGLVVDDPCPVCHGSGRGVSNRVISARIPAGVKDNQKIRLRGKGGPGEHGGPDGDLYIVVHVSPHRLFGRKGDNLTLTVPVRVDEAALGASIAVPTLDGRSVTLKIPAATPNGRTFRVKGRGAPGRGGTKGDLLVTVEVETPPALDDASRAAMEAFRDAAGTYNPRDRMLGQEAARHG